MRKVPRQALHDPLAPFCSGQLATDVAYPSWTVAVIAATTLLASEQLRYASNTGLSANKKAAPPRWKFDLNLAKAGLLLTYEVGLNPTDLGDDHAKHSTT